MMRSIGTVVEAGYTHLAFATPASEVHNESQENAVLKFPTHYVAICALLHVMSFRQQGDVVTATSFHERHHELAQAVDVDEEQNIANDELIKVRKHAVLSSRV